MKVVKRNLRNTTFLLFLENLARQFTVIVRRGVFMNNFLLDLRQSFRMLSRSSGFVVVAVIALGFGIAANSSVFTLLNAVALRPLPVEAPSKLITIYQIMRGLRERNVHGERSLFSLPEYM